MNNKKFKGETRIGQFGGEIFYPISKAEAEAEVNEVLQQAKERQASQPTTAETASVAENKPTVADILADWEECRASYGGPIIDLEEKVTTK